jgi:hypothetical protein
MAGAGAALVAVGVGDDSDLVPLIDRVLEEPLEPTPVRIHLDDGLERGIVEADDIGVAAADAGNQHDVVSPRELPEQLGDGKTVGGGVAHVVDFGVRGAVERGSVAAEHDVSVASARRHARPFVSDEDHAATVLVEAVDLPTESQPFFVGDLEVVRLMAHHVEQRHLASEGEVFLDRAGADRRASLAV